MDTNSPKQEYNPFSLTPPEQHATGQYQTYRDVKIRPRTNLLKAISIGTTQTTIAHGLFATPNFITVKIVSSGALATWMESQAADSTNIYLKASVATVADILVEFWPKNYK